jgi:predicted small integral membrane protein
MTDLADLPILRIVTCSGFAVWSLVAAFNNIVGFRGSAAAILGTMSMAPLREQDPIQTAFDDRAVRTSALPVLAVLLILLLQAGAAGLLATAAMGFICADLIPATPVMFAKWGFSLLAMAWFAMLIGGLWFGYWIRQEILQLTHLALLIATLLAALTVSS